MPHVRGVQFVSKQQAYAQQSKLDPQAYQLLGSNPLPDTFHVIPDNPGNVLARAQRADPAGAGGHAGPARLRHPERVQQEERHAQDPRGDQSGDDHRGRR